MNLKQHISGLIELAKISHRNTKLGLSPEMTEYSKGQRSAFIISARSLKGYATQARTVNSEKAVA